MSFDERMRLRAKMEDCPLPPGFLGRLETKAEEIAEGEESPMKKRVFRTILLAAALCAALTVAAMAASPTLREALLAALGSFEPYSQTMEGVSAVDGGIEIKVVSALMDEADGTAYLEVRDLEGDRLGETTRLSGNSTLRPLAYDPEEGTALYRMSLGQAYNERLRGRTEELELHFDKLFPNYIELPYEEMLTQLPNGTDYAWWKGETVIPAELYHSAETLESLYLKDEEINAYSAYGGDPVLAPEQTPLDLGSEYFSLSSLGFDDRGALHVQLKLAEGVSLMHCSDIEIDLLPGKLWSDYGLNGMSYCRVLFGEGQYLDVAFKDAGKALAQHLPDSTIYGELCTVPTVEGNWTLTIPYAPLSQRTVELHNAPFCAGGLELERVGLSAMGLRPTTTAGSQRIYLGGIEAHLYCRDGTVLPLKYDSVDRLYTNAAGETVSQRTLTYEQHQGADGWQHSDWVYSWSYPQAVDPQDVVGFSWGLWYVPLEGEAAGQGYWLSQTPVATE